ncbi:MAG: phage tail protein I [Desulfobacterales bacterium]|nr:phage tail protein I [Desulfobacterales bacterium]
MNKDLNHIDFLDLIPSSIAGDETIRAAARALNDDLNRISRETANLILFARIDELTEPMLSHLAWQFKVEFWEDNLTLAEKRGLIKESIAWHKIKGTPAAVERIGRIVFGSVSLSEWFQYNGMPGRFKLQTQEIVSSQDQYDRMFSMVDAAKNERSVLEALTVSKDKQDDIFNGGVVRITKKFRLTPYVHVGGAQGVRPVGNVIRHSIRVRILPHAFPPRVDTAGTAVAGMAVRKTIKLNIGAQHV